MSALGGKLANDDGERLEAGQSNTDSGLEFPWSRVSRFGVLPRKHDRGGERKKISKERKKRKEKK